MLIDILILCFLIILNGVFAMTELAIVSSRKSRLQLLAEKGSRGAQIALDLKEDPSKFISVTQIGITLIGILSGAYSGATLAEPLGAYLSGIPLFHGHGEDIAITLVVAFVTYLSLIVGELVPKQIALRHADTVAVVIALPIYWVARINRPLVQLLDGSSRLLLHLLCIPAETASAVSEEEVKAIIAEGTESGVFNAQEKKMMEGVMRLSELSIKATMTHRQDIVWLEADEVLENVARTIKESQHSHYLLCEKTRQNVIGVVSTKDIVVQLQEAKSINLRALAQDAISLRETTSVHDAITTFRHSRAHIALVIDEYGSLEGIITLKDILEAIIGLMPEPTDSEHPHILKRADGTLLVDGLLPLYEVESLLRVKNMQAEGTDYATLAGFLIHHFQRLPNEGDMLQWQDLHFEILDMDGRRIDKVLVTQPSAAE